MQPNRTTNTIKIYKAVSLEEYFRERNIISRTNLKEIKEDYPDTKGEIILFNFLNIKKPGELILSDQRKTINDLCFDVQKNEFLESNLEILNSSNLISEDNDNHELCIKENNELKRLIEDLKSKGENQKQSKELRDENQNLKHIIKSLEDEKTKSNKEFEKLGMENQLLKKNLKNLEEKNLILKNDQKLLNEKINLNLEDMNTFKNKLVDLEIEKDDLENTLKEEMTIIEKKLLEEKQKNENLKIQFEKECELKLKLEEDLKSERLKIENLIIEINKEKEINNGNLEDNFRTMINSMQKKFKEEIEQNDQIKIELMNKMQKMVEDIKKKETEFNKILKNEKENYENLSNNFEIERNKNLELKTKLQNLQLEILENQENEKQSFSDLFSHKNFKNSQEEIQKKEKFYENKYNEEKEKIDFLVNHLENEKKKNEELSMQLKEVILKNSVLIKEKEHLKNPENQSTFLRLEKERNINNELLIKIEMLSALKETCEKEHISYQKLENVQSLNNQLLSENSNLKKIQENFEKEKNDFCEKLIAENILLKNNQKQNEENFVNLKNDFNNLNIDKTNLEEELNHLQNLNNSLKKKINELEEEMNNLQNLNNSLKKRINDSEEELFNLENLNNSLKKKMNDSEEELKNRDNNIKKLKQNLNYLEEQNQTFSNLITNLQNNIKDLEEKRDFLSNTVKKIKNQNDDLIEENENLLKKNILQEKELENFKNNQSTDKVSKNVYKIEIEEMKEEIEGLLNIKKMLKNKNEELTEFTENLESENLKLKRNMKEINQNYQNEVEKNKNLAKKMIEVNDNYENTLSEMIKKNQKEDMQKEKFFGDQKQIEQKIFLLNEKNQELEKIIKKITKDNKEILIEKEEIGNKQKKIQNEFKFLLEEKKNLLDEKEFLKEKLKLFQKNKEELQKENNKLQKKNEDNDLNLNLLNKKKEKIEDVELREKNEKNENLFLNNVNYSKLKKIKTNLMKLKTKKNKDNCFCKEEEITQLNLLLFYIDGILNENKNESNLIIKKDNFKEKIENLEIGIFLLAAENDRLRNEDQVIQNIRFLYKNNRSLKKSVGVNFEKQEPEKDTKMNFNRKSSLQNYVIKDNSFFEKSSYSLDKNNSTFYQSKMKSNLNYFDIKKPQENTSNLNNPINQNYTTNRYSNPIISNGSDNYQFTKIQNQDKFEHIRSPSNMLYKNNIEKEHSKVINNNNNNYVSSHSPNPIRTVFTNFYPNQENNINEYRTNNVFINTEQRISLPVNKPNEVTNQNDLVRFSVRTQNMRSHDIYPNNNNNNILYHEKNYKYSNIPQQTKNLNPNSQNKENPLKLAFMNYKKTLDTNKQVLKENENPIVMDGRKMTSPCKEVIPENSFEYKQKSSFYLKDNLQKSPFKEIVANNFNLVDKNQNHFAEKIPKFPNQRNHFKNNNLNFKNNEANKDMKFQPKRDVSNEINSQNPHDLKNDHCDNKFKIFENKLDVKYKLFDSNYKEIYSKKNNNSDSLKSEIKNINIKFY